MSDSASALFEALNRDEPYKLLAALQAGADPNGRDEDGRTPLMFAAKRENRVALRLLLEFGALIDVQDAHGNTALIQSPSLTMKEFLLEQGARPDFGRIGGMTLAAFFANFRQREIVELLLHHGADPGEKDRVGRTIKELFDDPTFRWNPSEESPDRRKENQKKVLILSEELHLSPEEYVSRNWSLTFWGYGLLTYDDPEVIAWTREVMEVLRSFERIEVACRKYLEGETLARALVYLGRAQRKADRIAVKQSRWEDFAAQYWENA